MDYLKKLVTDIEIQSLEGIKECFINGINPNDEYNHKPLIYEVMSEYPRGPKFKEIIRLFVDHGLILDDQLLLAVLLDDPALLQSEATKHGAATHKRYTFQTAFTPINNASLLHICAEFNHTECIKMLIELGMDINSSAGTDEHGFGGQTAIFHTVNQHDNLCIDAMHMLLAAGADPLITIQGLIWGKNYTWETFIPSVNPISYAMMGLLPQFQRREAQIYHIVSALMKAAYGIEYAPGNIPNAYLKSR
jgi:hypothetical protein